MAREPKMTAIEACIEAVAFTDGFQVSPLVAEARKELAALLKCREACIAARATETRRPTNERSFMLWDQIDAALTAATEAGL